MASRRGTGASSSGVLDTAGSGALAAVARRFGNPADVVSVAGATGTAFASTGSGAVGTSGTVTDVGGAWLAAEASCSDVAGAPRRRRCGKPADVVSPSLGVDAIVGSGVWVTTGVAGASDGASMGSLSDSDTGFAAGADGATPGSLT